MTVVRSRGAEGRRWRPPGVARALAPVAAVLVLLVVLGAGAAGCGGDDEPAADGGEVAVAVGPRSSLDDDPSASPAPSPTPPPSRSAASPTSSSTAAGSSAAGSSAGGAAEVGPRVVTGAGVLARDDCAALAGLRIGLIANRASEVDGESVIDLLDRAPDVDLVALFAPEHGLRAEGESGAEVVDGVDPVTGLVVHSLYGDDRAPTPEALADLDLLVFDLQDVGARFYTYTSTMGLAMQAAAAADVPFLVLDRPSPLGDAVDGPVRADGAASFVSLYPVPSLHGMTAGELASAIRGEGWLDGLAELELDVVELEGWDRSRPWGGTGLDWVPPSPGLPTADSVLVYPATVLLEATIVSYGQGTDRPFTQVGAPWLDADELAARLRASGPAGLEVEVVEFVPRVKPSAPEPRYLGETVPGVRLGVGDPATLRPMAVAVHLLHHLLALADEAGVGPVIERPDFFDLLAGGPALRTMLLAGDDPAAIVASWEADLRAFAELRAPYLRY